jgi:hypothetical protein
MEIMKEKDKKRSFVLERDKCFRVLAELGLEKESSDFVRGFVKGYLKAVEDLEKGDLEFGVVGFDWEDMEQTALEDDVL